MTEKIKLTAEQAKAIEILLRTRSKENILNLHASSIPWDGNNADYLNKLSQADLAKSLLIGYEVEMNYKVGDWVRYWRKDRLTRFGKLTYINYEKGLAQFDNCTITKKIEDITRHATPEEVEIEKERRWWKSHDREVWELKQGDILMATRRRLYEVTATPKSHRFNSYTGNDNYDFDIEECKRDNWEVVCFRDDRKDVD